METRVTFSICQCGRHGHYIDPETGDIMGREVFGKDAAIEVFNSIQEGLAAEMEIDPLMRKLLFRFIWDSSLPQYEPLFAGALIVIHANANVVAGDATFSSNDEYDRDIHAFMRELPPFRYMIN